MKTETKHRQNSATPPQAKPSIGEPTLGQRLYYALGPLAGCMLLDLADFLTFGPIALVIGIPVGATIGWWLGSMYGFEKQGRAILAALSGIYCTIPFTELLPIATIVGAVARFNNPQVRPPVT